MVNEKFTVLLYDGNCVLCNYAVRKVLKWDKEDKYRIGSLQSEPARNILKKFDIPKDLDSLILIKSERIYFRSKAFLKVLKDIKPYHPFRIFVGVLPSKMADFFYRLIARNRYRWFGRYDSCPILPEKYRHKILK